MKTPSDELFRLIKSLDPQEKVHFKMFAQRKSDDNSYLLVFDAVNEMVQYDEEELKRSLKKHPQVLKNLKRVKNYTLDAILKSLSSFHSYTTVQSELRNLLHQAEILSGKKFFKLAGKILDKAESLASENDQFEYLLLASTQRAELASRSEDIPSVEGYIDNNIPKEREYTAKILQDISFRELGFKTFLLNLNLGFGQKAKEKIAQLLSNSPLMSTSPETLSFSSKGYYYRLNYIAAMAKGAPERKDLEKHMERIRYLESIPHKVPQVAEIYLSAISSLFALNTYFNDKEYTEKYLSKALTFYNTLPVKVRTDLVSSALAKVINNYMHCQLVWSDPGAAIHAWKRISKAIPNMSRIFEKDLLQTIYVNLLQAHFMIEEHKIALGYVNKVMEHKSTSFRMDVQIISRFYLLMIHYELGNMDILDHLCDRVERWLVKAGFFGPYEKKILFFFRRTIHGFNTNSERVKVFKSFKKELEALAPDAKGIVMEYFVSWIDSKIEEKTFIEVLRQNQVYGHG